MKVTIVDNGKNKTRWDYIEIGTVFRDGPPDDYFMKIEEIYDARENHFNAVNLKTGELIGFMEDFYVKVVDAELVVKER
jgi:hypothetical protein